MKNNRQAGFLSFVVLLATSLSVSGCYVRHYDVLSSEALAQARSEDPGIWSVVPAVRPDKPLDPVFLRTDSIRQGTILPAASPWTTSRIVRTKSFDRLRPWAIAETVFGVLSTGFAAGALRPAIDQADKSTEDNAAVTPMVDIVLLAAGVTSVVVGAVTWGLDARRRPGELSGWWTPR